MSTRRLSFRHEVVDADPPGTYLDITLLADLTGSGRPDIIIGGTQGAANLFWYENPSWARHEIARAPFLEAGGVLFDVTGNGRLDIVVGQQSERHHLYWFEQPADPRQPWPMHVIEDRFDKYHDQAVGDVDNDGEPEILVASQRSGVLAYYDIPADPFVEPWPRECCHVIAEGLYHVEGLVVTDIDGDGRNEVIAGTSIFRPAGAGEPWHREVFADGFRMTRVAVADLDGDGRQEIVVAEGESDPGRLVWFSQPGWKAHALRADLFHPHSLAIADFDGDGRPDIFVAEMGLGKNPDPKMLVYLNDGNGRFQEVLIGHGIPTHEAKVADMTGDGRPDIVGKPFHPERHVDIWYNET